MAIPFDKFALIPRQADPIEGNPIPGMCSANPRLKVLFKAVAIACSSLFWMAQPEAAGLPVPCSPCSGGPATWVTSGAASLQVQGGTMNINQTTDKAILNWREFNIAAGNAVNFNQPSSSSVALNRIFDANASQILGSLTANGQVMLINQNGIVFGSGSQVNVNSLVASTLDVPDDVFNTIGLANAINQGRPAFEAAGPMKPITIESGARLQSAEFGRIMILAPQIENKGDISTPGGQAILAAGQDKVYLAAADQNSDVRGLLVEVKTGGDVTNLGSVIAAKGNVTLLGYAVNQSGIARATTSVNLNGSVHLIARDHASLQSSGVNTQTAVATRAGALTLGAGSMTEVAPDNLNETAVDAQIQPISTIELEGSSVHLQSGANVIAHGGNVNVTATMHPETPAQAGLANNGASIVMDPGSSIDVSGLTSAEFPVSRNMITVELRSNELANSPLLRDGPLHGKTVYVDIRTGTPIANVQGQIDALQRPLSERLAAGGGVSMLSEGDITLPPGASVNFAGGLVTYDGGMVNSTRLIANGRLYDIGSAPANLPYTGIFGDYTVNHATWAVTDTFTTGAISHWEDGYVQGLDAGTLTLNARSLSLGASLIGGTTAGRYQRLPATGNAIGFARPYDQMPLGGLLALGNPNPAAGIPDLGLSDITLSSLGDMGATGIGRLNVYSNGRITLPSAVDLTLQSGGQLQLTAGQVDLAGRVTAPGGSVKIIGEQTQATNLNDVSVQLDQGGGIDVAGLWVNDSVAINPGGATGPVVIDGGAVSITAAGDVGLQQNSLIDASGGAQLTSDGILKSGKGGEITLSSFFAQPNPKHLAIAGSLVAEAIAQGGTLNLTGPGFDIGADASTGGNRTPLPASFFAQGGFSAFNLTATHSGINVLAGTTIDLQARNAMLDGSFGSHASSGDIHGFSTMSQLPVYARSATSLSLTLARVQGPSAAGGITLGTGSLIRTEAQGQVFITTDTRMDINGTIQTPAGDIKLSLIAPTDANNELGFDPTQAIWLGSDARLQAQGIVREVPQGGSGVMLGQALDAGTVTVSATRGYLFSASGALIDVSGASAILPDTRQDPAQFNASGGTVTLQAAEGMVVKGSILGQAGDGAGAAGGTLNIVFDSTHRTDGVVPDPINQPIYPTTPRQIVLGAVNTNIPAVGSAVPNALNGQALVDPQRLVGSGVDQLVLTSRPVSSSSPDSGQIHFSGDVNLQTAERLVLDAPVIQSDGGGTMTLNSAYVALGSSSGSVQSIPSPTSGDGGLIVTARQLDLIGALGLRGFGGANPNDVSLQSSGDIRMTGVRIDSRSDGVFLVGGLNSTADVTLRADQIYPSTITDYNVTVSRTGGRIAVVGGNRVPAPLSAVSRLTLQADSIVQGGTLRAPFGQITLIGNASVVLAPGSLTSVSGNGQIVPFGITQFGDTWLYPVSTLQHVYSNESTKNVSVNAPSITMQAGSVVDVTGGGDLHATEFVPGPGGSYDVLGADNTNGSFAILPTLSSGFGAYDPNLNSQGPVQPGQTITFADNGAVPAGTYAVLPAGYALLPGAYLVTPVKGTADLIPGTMHSNYDGSILAAGKHGIAGTNILDGRWSGYELRNGTQVRSLAQYNESLGDSFFASSVVTSGARLNRDAGSLVLAAGQSLVTAGTLAQSAAGGRGSLVDIVANKLLVTTQRTGASGSVELVDSELNGLGAESLLLGGTRGSMAGGIAIDVQAKNVEVGSGVSLTLPSIYLVAKDTVAVDANASLSAAGNAVSGPGTVSVTGDGALLRVSTGAQVSVQRSGSASVAGVLDVGAGALLASSGSITLESSKDTRLGGAIASHGGSLSLVASRISLGEVPAATSGLILGNDRLAALDAAELILASRQTIDFYGTLNSQFNKLILDAAGIGGYSNAGKTASISADSISMRNGGRSITGAPDGTGGLMMSARTIDLTGGDFSVRGFNHVTLNAAETLSGQGAAGLLVAGNLTLSAARLTTGAGASLNIEASDASGAMVGNIDIAAPAAPAALPAITDLGGSISLTALSINDSSRIELPSGVLKLHAMGGGGIVIDDKAVVDVSGIDLRFGNSTVSSPGGMVDLIADTGGIDIAAGARVAVAGGSQSGDAGALSLAAGAGAVNIDPGAVLAGAAGSGGTAANFVLDAQSVGGSFSALNAALNATGFTGVRSLRLRSGDINIAAGELIKANDLTLTVDNGAIDIAGALDASGTTGGRVSLNALNNLTLEGSARIDAHATGAGQRGGQVELSTVSGQISIKATNEPAASTIDVAGGGTDSGTVHLRVPRNVGNTSVGITALDGQVSGTQSIELEAFKVYTSTTLNNSLANTMKADNTSFMNHATAIETTLGINGDSRYILMPGNDVQSAGSLTVSNDLDLLGWRYNGALATPGVLTLRAASGLNVNGSLSDGVALEDPLAAIFGPTGGRSIAQTGSSWSYRLIAGADTTSADVLAVVGGGGNLTLAAGKVIRTGTGTVDAVAGGNIKLTDSGSAIYTVGVARAPSTVPDFGFGSSLVPVLAEYIYGGDFLSNGGDINIRALGDIQGVNGHQLVNEWQTRIGGMVPLAFGDAYVAPSWSINMDNFKQNVGALGGGNVSISAGGTISDLSAVVATSALPAASTGQAPDVSGGGNLTLTAGGDVKGGVFYVGKGQGTIRAGGAVTHTPGGEANPVLALGSGQYDIRARDGVTIESVVNPTLLPQIPISFAGTYETYFFTYTQDSGVSLQSIAGNVLLDNNNRILTTQISNSMNFGGAGGVSATAPLYFYPGTLNAEGLQGSVLIGGGFTTYPSANGNLSLLASGDIGLSPTGSTSVTVNLSDADPALLPGVINPTNSLADANSRLASYTGDLTHAAVPVHLGDAMPAQLISRNGSIGALTPLTDFVVSLSKAARVEAGQNITNLNLLVQHISPQDVTVVQAGGDITFPTVRNTVDGSLIFNRNAFELAGPGHLDVIAGGNVDLGGSVGVLTVGNLKNPALSGAGADVTVMAGVGNGPDYKGFIQKYLVDSNQYRDQMAQFLASINASGTDINSFLALPEETQWQLVLQIFFDQLKQSGVTETKLNNGDFSGGFAAIEALFPSDQTYHGDIKSFLSRITTLDGGDINLLAPGGLVNAGVAVATGITKSAGDLGIVVQRDGSINSFSNGDFLVNQSRVFALDGGDILMWSSAGNIDAGRGAKTALSVPPPTVTFDAKGNAIVEFPPVVSGSGIRAAVSTVGKKPGDVYLFAPKGVINAGDAGIGSAGNITIAATQVIGSENISVGGVSVGVPTVNTGSLAAGLSSVGDVGSAATKSVSDAASSGLAAKEAAAQSQQTLASTSLSFISVEVVGFGGN